MNVLLGVAQPRDRHMARFLMALGPPRGTTIHVVHVVEFPTLMNHITGRSAVDLNRQASTHAQELVTRVAAPLSTEGLEIHSLVQFGRPGPILLDTAERLGVELTVVSPYRSSRLAKFLLGSVTDMLLNEVPSSLLVVRTRPRRQLQADMTIVLAMDFSRDAQTAAKFLVKFSLTPQSRIILLHVEEAADTVLDRMSRLDTELPPVIERAKRERKRQTLLMLDRIGRQLQQRDLLVDKMLEEGNAAVQILRMAERHRADLIVMGSKGLAGLERYVMGSVSRKVARHALCSVLVVKGAKRAAR